MSSSGANSNPRRSYDGFDQASNPSGNIASGESSRLLSPALFAMNELNTQRSQTTDQQSRDPTYSNSGGPPIRSSRNVYSQLPLNAAYSGDVELTHTFAPATSFLTRANGSNQRVNAKSRLSASHLTYVIVIYIIAVFVGSLGYVTLRQSQNLTSRQLQKLLNRVQDLDTSISSKEIQNSLILVDIQSQLLDQQLTLKHLSNLSNAHVLIELEETRTDLYQRMLTTQSKVQSDLEAVQLNVTQNIALSRSAVVELLDKTQTNMTEMQNDNAREFNGIILKAGTVARDVQLNVTHQLERNDEQLRGVVEITNKALIVAQRNLTANLARSRQELSEATADTNAAIAAAERNVTLKLSKSASEFKAAVATATEQLEIVQRNVSLSLSVMSGTLRATSADLNAQVETAKITIHEEVQAVQDSIEQYVAFTDKKLASENDFVRYQLAGTFTLLGCLISLWHLTSHLRHYYKPDVQRRVMAVLWMVPIYSVTSWFSLVFPSYDAVFAAVRDCYEAYAVYTFIALLIAILVDGQGLSHLIDKLAAHVVEERRALSEAILKKTRRPVMHLRPPFPCCYAQHKPYTVAAAWLFQCQLMTMQFVMMKPILTALPFILRLWDKIDYDGRPPILNNTINLYSPKLYIQLAENVSVAVAFYALLSFFHGTEKDLAWCDPWPKFLCIKGVVFMTFWQGFIIQAMGSLGMVNEKAALQIQNLLICIEMLIASLAHFYIFPYHEWQEGYKSVKEKTIHIRDTLALRDFARDMKMMVTTWDVCSSPVNLSAVRTRSQSEDSSLSVGVTAEEKKEKERYSMVQNEGDVNTGADESEHWILGSSSNFLQSANMGHGVVAFPSLFGDLETGCNLKVGPSISSSIMENSLLSRPKDSLKERESNPVDGLDSNPVGGLDSNPVDGLDSNPADGLASYRYTLNPLRSSSNSRAGSVGKSKTSMQSLAAPGGSEQIPVSLHPDLISRNSAGPPAWGLATSTGTTWGNRDSPPNIRDSSPNTAFRLPTSRNISRSIVPPIHPPLPSQSSGESLRSATFSNSSSNQVVTDDDDDEEEEEEKKEMGVDNMAVALPSHDDSRRDVWSWSVPGKMGLNVTSAGFGGSSSLAQESVSKAQRGSSNRQLSSIEQMNETNLMENDDGISCSSLESSMKITNSNSNSDSDSDSDHDSNSPFHNNPGNIDDSIGTAGVIMIGDTSYGTSLGLRQDEVEEEEDDMSNCLLSVCSSKIMEKSAEVSLPTTSLGTSIFPSKIQSSDSINLESDSYSDGCPPCNSHGDRNTFNQEKDKKTEKNKKLSSDFQSGRMLTVPSAIKEHLEFSIKEHSVITDPDITVNQITGSSSVVSLFPPTAPPLFLPTERSWSVRSHLVNSQKVSGVEGDSDDRDDYRDRGRKSASGNSENAVRLKIDDDEEEEDEKDTDSVDSSSLFSTTSQDVELRSEIVALGLSHTIASSSTVHSNLKDVELLETESV